MPPATASDAHSPAFLQVQDVTLQRGSTSVFKGLNLQLLQHRIGLIGDNGSGKSSLFRMLCGLELPLSGTVTVRGLPAHRVSAQRPGLVGMMFQNPDEQIIFPTVEEELALGLSPQGMARREALLRARAFLEARKLGHWAARTVGSLSQGQRQHVCWLALVIATPELLLLDEPFASLDLPGQVLLETEIARAPQQVIVSTHLLSHVRHFERVIWLDKGQIRADGTGPEICAAYEADVTIRIAAQTLSIG